MGKCDKFKVAFYSVSFTKCLHSKCEFRNCNTFADTLHVFLQFFDFFRLRCWYLQHFTMELHKKNINLNSAAIRWWPHTYVYTMCTTQLGFFGIMFNPMHDLLSSYNNFFRRNRFHRSISRNLICLENDSNYYLKSNQIRLLGNEFIVKQRQSINFQFFFRNVIIKLLDSTDVNF